MKRSNEELTELTKLKAEIFQLKKENLALKKMIDELKITKDLINEKYLNQGFKLNNIIDERNKLLKYYENKYIDQEKEDLGLSDK